MRLAVHKQSFKNPEINQTSLSKHILELKDKKVNFTLTWEIIGRGKPFSPVSKMCTLCNLEKFSILFSPELSDLNSKSEMYSNCRHKQSILLVPKERKKKKKGPG